MKINFKPERPGMAYGPKSIRVSAAQDYREKNLPPYLAVVLFSLYVAMFIISLLHTFSMAVTILLLCILAVLTGAYAVSYRLVYLHAYNSINVLQPAIQSRIDIYGKVKYVCQNGITVFRRRMISEAGWDDLYNSEKKGYLKDAFASMVAKSDSWSDLKEEMTEAFLDLVDAETIYLKQIPYELKVSSIEREIRHLENARDMFITH